MARPEYPSRKYELEGPDVDKLSVEETAKYFDYDEHTWATMVREGKAPAPRGLGTRLYYTGEDLAAIRLMLGRWLPRPTTAEKPRRSKNETPENEAEIG